MKVICLFLTFCYFSLSAFAQDSAATVTLPAYTAPDGKPYFLRPFKCNSKRTLCQTTGYIISNPIKVDDDGQWSYSGGSGKYQIQTMLWNEEVVDGKVARFVEEVVAELQPPQGSYINLWDGLNTNKWTGEPTVNGLLIKPVSVNITRSVQNDGVHYYVNLQQ